MTGTADIRVFSGGATQGAFACSRRNSRRNAGKRFHYVFEVTAALDARLAAGEKADVLVLPVPLLENYAKAGKARAETQARSASLASASR